VSRKALDLYAPAPPAPLRRDEAAPRTGIIRAAIHDSADPIPDPRTIAARSGRPQLSPRFSVVCLALLGFALYLQHVKGLDPCRGAGCSGSGFMAASALIAPDRWRCTDRAMAGVSRIAPLGLRALAGVAAGVVPRVAAVGSRDAPAKVASARRSERILDALQLGRLAPPAAAVRRAVHAQPWSLLGLSDPEWSLAWFVLSGWCFSRFPSSWLAERLICKDL